MAKQKELKVADYTEFLNEHMLSPNSLLRDRYAPVYSEGGQAESSLYNDPLLTEYQDSIEQPARQDTDAQPIITSTIIRTSKSGDRAQMSSTNELGASQGGFYLYVNNLIRTAYTEGTIFFYDLSGAVSSVIQQPTPGNLSISSDSIDIIGTTDITLSAPLITLDGVVVVNQGMAANYIAITDGITTPSTVAGLGQIYIDTADGDLKIKFGDGTVKTIVVDT